MEFSVAEQPKRTHEALDYEEGSVKPTASNDEARIDAPAGACKAQRNATGKMRSSASVTSKSAVVF